MFSDKSFVSLAQKELSQGRAEVGMHLHAWNSPPMYNLTSDDFAKQPLLIEYPTEVMKAKIEFMTRLLEDTFSRKPVSHRAGRWGFNSVYAELLLEFGYKVDCSVTPGVSWEKVKKGLNYRDFPNKAYFIDLKDIRREGDSKLLEVPVTIIDTYSLPVEKLFKISTKLAQLIAHRFKKISSPKKTWLRPNGRNLKRMLVILDRALLSGWDYVEFMIHSSELMPGGSPRFRSKEEVEKLYSDTEQLFKKASFSFEGATLSEYYSYILGGE